jgi:hypothetical protein
MIAYLLVISKVVRAGPHRVTNQAMGIITCLPMNLGGSLDA